MSAMEKLGNWVVVGGWRYLETVEQGREVKSSWRARGGWGGRGGGSEGAVQHLHHGEVRGVQEPALPQHWAIASVHLLPCLAPHKLHDTAVNVPADQVTLCPPPSHLLTLPSHPSMASSALSRWPAVPPELFLLPRRLVVSGSGGRVSVKARVWL